MKNSFKQKKGITLIALVITIIVLLILAGISIGMLSGDNGLLKIAEQAKKDTVVGEEKEQVELAYLSAAVKNLRANVTAKNLQDELDASVGENKTTVTGTSILKIKFEDTQNEYILSRDGKVEKKNSNPNALKISELNENASMYFGWDVINYAETLPEELQDTKWQLFYAGALNGETEERIYLISKEYIKNTQIPSVVKNGITVTPESKPIPVNQSNYKAFFSTYQSNPNNINDGVLKSSLYSGSSNVATEMRKYNKDYFKDYTSTNPNMRAIAYMLDTSTWSPFVSSSNYYVDWAIGGPTVELLFTAYNKYAGTAYEADAISEVGYQVRKTSNDNYDNFITGALEDDTPSKDNPYSISNINNQANAYWLASPSYSDAHSIMLVGDSGAVSNYYYGYTDYGFRPLLLLNSNYTLEKVKDSNGNDAFEIVEK